MGGAKREGSGCATSPRFTWPPTSGPTPGSVPTVKQHLAAIEEPKAALFQSIDAAGRRLTGRALERRVVLAMIKRRAATCGAPALDVTRSGRQGSRRISRTGAPSSTAQHTGWPRPRCDTSVSELCSELAWLVVNQDLPGEPCGRGGRNTSPRRARRRFSRRRKSEAAPRLDRRRHPFAGFRDWALPR